MSTVDAVTIEPHRSRLMRFTVFTASYVLTNPQSLKLSWVGDAIGGSVSLSADQQTITFTPTAGYTGSLEFAYQITDSAGHASPTVVDSLNQQGPLKARVLLTPANAQ